MKLTYTRDNLINETGAFWWKCGICHQGSTSADFIKHTESCPFSDGTVKELNITVGPVHDSFICSDCKLSHTECPAMTEHGGWDNLTHERLQMICSDYERVFKKNTAADKKIAAAICGDCDVAIISCPACIHAENGAAVTDHEKLRTICARYKHECGI